jgi:hypothetical protein
MLKETLERIIFMLAILYIHNHAIKVFGLSRKFFYKAGTASQIINVDFL